jgi:hypothetical protein
VAAVEAADGAVVPVLRAADRRQLHMRRDQQRAVVRADLVVVDLDLVLVPAGPDGSYELSVAATAETHALVHRRCS